MRIGLRISEVREELGKTQEDVAEAIGSGSVQNYQRYERGTLNVTIGVLVRIANALGVDPATFFEPPRKTARPSGRRPKLSK